ncbi:MAG: Maf family protein [Pirellulaceae bacterium]|nr:Maf family protein [Pirellulaceae bacterium]
MPSSPHQLVLASSSPRRKELLTEAGYSFTIVLPDDSVEDPIHREESVREYVARLAFQKAKSVIPKIESGLVLACDTLAYCEGELLGKPTDQDEARRMVTHLSGKEHQVYSGLCLWDKTTGQKNVEVETSILSMKPLSPKELDDYLATDLWVGKAGAFGYQDGHPWLTLTSGSPSNVVGLPLERLKAMLSSFIEATL